MGWCRSGHTDHRFRKRDGCERPRFSSGWHHHRFSFQTLCHRRAGYCLCGSGRVYCRAVTKRFPGAVCMSVETPVAPAHKRQGKHTLVIDNVRIAERATVVGPREGAGPMGKWFDQVETDHMVEQPTPEKAERYFLKQAIQLVLQKANLSPDDIDVFLSGDLLNQVVTSNFTARDMGIPFFGLFSACATFGAGLSLGSVLVDSGFATRVLVSAS